MKHKIVLFLLILLEIGTTAVLSKADPQKPDTVMYNYKLSVTQHVANIGGHQIPYTATTGYMPIYNSKGHRIANVFFVAYTRKGVKDSSKRPIMFAFNGGPGSSSVWLHLGGVGPMRVDLLPDGNAPAPPYKVVDNHYSWLDMTDLVFVDPVGTGYSRPAKGVSRSDFDGYNQDIRSVANFIRRYLTKYQRWGSPKFLLGESYGTTRAAGLSGYLEDHDGIYLNGIILQSSALNFQTFVFNTGNDLPYILYLPSYTATAWYHKKLPADLQSEPLKEVLKQSQHFALNEYANALIKGDDVSNSERQDVTKKLSRFTGLSPKYVAESDMRIQYGHFRKQLLRDKDETVGRYDSRFIGLDREKIGSYPDYDPSYSTATLGPFTAAINEYMRSDLDYKNKLPYRILTGKVYPWDFSNVENRYLNVSETLRSAMTKNPHLKVMVACGYYDLATPYFSVVYTIRHMQLAPSLRSHITIHYYKSGHMIYINHPSLEKYKMDAKAFINSAVPH